MKKIVFFMLHLVGFNTWHLKLLRGIWEEAKVSNSKKIFLFVVPIHGKYNKPKSDGSFAICELLANPEYRPMA